MRSVMCKSAMRSRFLGRCLVALMVAAGARGTSSAAADVPSAQKILQQTDTVRNPATSFTVMNHLEEYRNGVQDDYLDLQVYSKPDPTTMQFRNLASYIAPTRDAGKMFLMSGNVMWFYDPAASASIRISPQQRLIGQASNGDVLSVNLNTDYKAELVGEEEVKDADRNPRQTWHLNLTAATPRATYARVEYWVEQGSYYPVKGRFYSDSGQVLKVAFYLRYQPELGGMRPTQVIIVDQVDPSLVTKMSFSQYKEMDIPESWFDYQFLPRLRPK
jgi:outer membrane lipoprotein-sorting protein